MMRREPPDVRHPRCDPEAILIAEARGVALTEAASMTAKERQWRDGAVIVRRFKNSLTLL